MTAVARRIPSLLLIVGGALKISLWILFISLHGPTSYNEERTFIGGDPLIWGAIMSAVPSLFVAAGLIGNRALLATGALRRVGFVLALIALVVPAIVDLASRALWPPLLVPLLAVGVLLMAGSARRPPVIPVQSTVALVAIGVLLTAVFLFMVLTPLEVFDAIEGYRLQGIVEHVLVGLGWIAAGVGLIRRPASEPVPVP